MAAFSRLVAGVSSPGGRVADVDTESGRGADVSGAVSRDVGGSGVNGGGSGVNDWGSGVNGNAPGEVFSSSGRVADVYLEGSDQHRGWFQSSLLTKVRISFYPSVCLPACRDIHLSVYLPRSSFISRYLWRTCTLRARTSTAVGSSHHSLQRCGSLSTHLSLYLSVCRDIHLSVQTKQVTATHPRQEQTHTNEQNGQWRNLPTLIESVYLPRHASICR